MSNWKSQKAAYQEALRYVNARKEGIIRSFKTPWSKMNDAGVDGFEWHSMIVIGGRPGTGKTLIKDQIVREAFRNNEGENFRVLEFSFEMVARASKVREFSSILGKPYKYVCSANDQNRLSDEDLQKLFQHSKKAIDIDKCPVDIVENPCTIEAFKREVGEYMEEHAIMVDSKDKDGNPIKVKKYTNTVITVDHSLLFKQGKGQSKTDMLYELGEAGTLLKRKYPIILIILSQLGRHVETPERNENGKYGNYILETDIFGGDALMQHADMVVGINRPAKKFIQFYGPEKYIIVDDTVLVWHFIKCRSGDTRMSFMKAEFDKMEVTEMLTPQRHQRKAS